MDPTQLPPDLIATGIGAGAVSAIGLLAWAAKTAGSIGRELATAATRIAADLATISEELRHIQSRVNNLTEEYRQHAAETRDRLGPKPPHKPHS